MSAARHGEDGTLPLTSSERVRAAIGVLLLNAAASVADRVSRGSHPSGDPSV
jgi:hypothetical protein